MINKLNSLIINSKEITPKNISEVNDDTIRLFLQEWWNENDYILQKTSGSTGAPKEIKLQKLNMINSARATLDFFNLQTNQEVLLCLPVEFIAGKMMLIRAMLGGLKVDYIGHDTKPLQHTNPKKNYDFCAMIPLQVEHSIREHKDKYEKISTVLIGGASVSPKLRLELLRCKNNAYASFGMTETITHIALQKIELANKDELYRALKGVSLQQDERGCLIIQAPEICEQEIRTNDVVEFFDFNTFKWLGRADHVINSGGLKIHPEELEKLIAEIIQDRNFFIGSAAHENLGQEIVLFLEGDLLDTTTENLLVQHLKESLPKNKSPKRICYLEQFSYSENGKLLRNESAKRCFSKS